MKLSKLSYAVVIASCVVAGAAQAAVKTSGTVAFTTDYKFRGISQTNTNAAVQGSMTLNHDSGVYFTAWGSSIADTTGASGLELDTLLGYAFSKGDVSYDVGVMRYNYPGRDGGQATAAGSKRTSYNEAYASASLMGAKLGVAVSDDYFNDSGRFSYTYLEYATEITNGFGFASHVGYNKFGSAAGLGKALGVGSTGENSYLDYKAGITKSVESVGFDLSYIGTDINKSDLGSKLGQSALVLTATKAF